MPNLVVGGFLSPFLLTGGLGVGSFPPSVGATRDRLILAAMAQAVRLTQQFDLVVTSGLNEIAANMTADQTRICAMELTGFNYADEDTADDEDTVRTVFFAVSVLVRHEDADVRDDEADRLANLVENTIGHQSFAGASPALTYLSDGEWMPARPPERLIRINGQTAYVIESWDAHDDAA